ncbi:thioesterase family protein [uncultured Psychroserpens sp.]|nr:acyl-CoA thioesterase [uncultured Psychroserpens sp.]
MINETHRSTIYPWHCDFNNHMNVQYYVAKFDEATWHFLHQIGYSKEVLKAKNASMVAVEQHIKYYKELIAGDLIYIKSSLIKGTDKTIKFSHKMYNAQTNKVAADTELIAMMIDNVSRKSIHIKKINQF